MDESTPDRRASSSSKSDAQQSFVRNLRWARERLGLTYRALAHDSGVDEDWLRRAGTQGLRWTKQTREKPPDRKATGKDAVTKLEDYLGCPFGTLWEPDGHRFREGVTNKHLRVLDPVTDFEVVYRHFQGNPPPVLARMVEIVADLRRSIDDPSHQPPEGQLVLQPENEEVVTWKPKSGWEISESALDQMVVKASRHIARTIKTNVPMANEIVIKQEQIITYLNRYDLYDIGLNAWFEAYRVKSGMSLDEIETLLKVKQAEYKAREAEEVQRAQNAIQSARSAANESARLLFESLPDDVRDWYVEKSRRLRYALLGLEQELFALLTGEDIHAKMTTEEAVEMARSVIVEDFRRCHQSDLERGELDAPPSERAERPQISYEPKGFGEPRIPSVPISKPEESKQVLPVTTAAMPSRPAARRTVSPDGPGSTTDDPPNLQHVLIKWTGSKRRQARQIVARFPRRINTYYEPFLGGGSVLYELLGSDIKVGRYEVSDICKPLVDLWQMVRFDPTDLVEGYTQHWKSLQSGGVSYYNEVRRVFNRSNDPHLFFFLLRTCRNGLVRFNQDGKFNSGFHGDRPGMAPNRVKKIVEDWERRLAGKDVRFSNLDHRCISPQEGDLLYLDPPYLNEDGKYYYGKFDLDEFFEWLRKQPCNYLLSLNGFLGDQDRTVAVPADLFDEHILLDNGISSFERLNDDEALPVKDSLYIRKRGT